MENALARTWPWFLARALCFAVVTIAFVATAPDAPISTAIAWGMWFIISACILGGRRVTATLVPYRNAPALSAYYCAVLSLCPILGLPFSIAAITLGFRGVKLRREKPESKGRVHAWFGIIVGVLTIVMSLVFMVYLLVVSLC